MKNQFFKKGYPLPLLPLRNAVLFPHLVMPLTIARKETVAAVEAAMQSEEKTILVVAQKQPAKEEPTAEDLYLVGTKAIIKKVTRAAGVMSVIVVGVERVSLENIKKTDNYLESDFKVLPSPEDTGIEIDALHRSVIETASKIQQILQPETDVKIESLLADMKDPLDQAYLLANILNMELAKEQALLEAPSRLQALRLMFDYLSHEAEVESLRQTITSRAEKEMTKQQKEFLLRQQLRAIQEELGDTAPEQVEVDQLRERAEKAELPDEVKREVDRELSYLERLNVAASDYQVTRSHLELAIEMPWTKTTEDNLDLDRAQRILDEDHHNLKQVKDRILEELAVLKMNPKARAPILCFVGPPGTGKTSVGQSIAKALGRKFERMSLGGMHDEAELRGHRRTYVGAMPGRVIQAIRRAGVKNPLLMLDELDKLGRDFRGDPAAALMEILDPAQNNSFRDNYLDLPFDLSKVFFIATANTLQNIPTPLLDRMEVISLSGYSEEEKLQIANRYLIPRQLGHGGLTLQDISISDEVVLEVIRRYTREAGLRQLERALGKIIRKVDRQIAQGAIKPISVTPLNLHEYLGSERFFLEKLRKKLPPGVATGMAWTENGGEVLYIETAFLPLHKENPITMTGQLGEVMQESVETALTYVLSHPEQLPPAHPDFLNLGVHVHVPAGAIPKDGPSAGVAILSALASLFTGRTVSSDTAMTGEITLTGLVLPVGGIKEKVLAARRAGIRQIILPKANESDLSELPEAVRRDLVFVLVENVSQVLEESLVFPLAA